jgi:hypothetical protein
MLHATHNKQTTISITTFIIKHDKFWGIAFHRKHNVLKLIIKHSLCGICRMSYCSNIMLKEKPNIHYIYITFTTFHAQMMSLLSHFCCSLNSACTYTRCAILCSYISSEHYTHGCRTVQLYVLHILPILSSKIDRFLLQVEHNIHTQIH